MMITEKEIRARWAENGEYRRRCEFKRAIVRLEICLGRMRACREEHPDAHAVSVDEIPAWIAEMKEVMDAWPEGCSDDAE